MYIGFVFPNLSYISNYFFGTPVDNRLAVIQTFGLFLILAFIGGYNMFKYELQRRERNGIIEGVKSQAQSQSNIPLSIVIGNFIVGFLVGFKLPLFINNTTASSFKNMLFSMDGSIIGGMIGAILLGGTGLYMYVNQKDEQENRTPDLLFPSHYAIELTILSAITGLIGSKLFSVAENLPAFFNDPIRTFFSGSGLTIYGGLITAFIFGYFYMKSKGFKRLPIMDSLSPALLVGYMLGRFGCHFSGDGDWGKVNTIQKPDWLIIPDWLWSWRYPHNVVNSSVESIPMENCGGLISANGGTPIFCKILPQGVYPTPLYEIMMCLVILVVVILISKKTKVPGFVFFSYLAMTGVERFVIEFIRVNERYGLLGLDWSLSQWIALVMTIIGLVGMVVLVRNSKRGVKVSQ